MQTVKRVFYGSGLSLATCGFIRGFNAREYKNEYQNKIDTVKLLKPDVEPLIIDRTISGIVNGLFYVIPPYCLIHAFNSLARMEIALTKKDPMKYKNFYREYGFFGNVYRFPRRYEQGDYQQPTK